MSEKNLFTDIPGNSFKEFLLFCTFILLGLSGYSQEKAHYFYHISIPNFDSLEITKKTDGSLEIFSLESLEENEIFRQHKVLEFQPAFPNTLKENLKIVYRITTASPTLVYELEKLKPEKYQKIGEYFPPKVSYYPNDYGTTSPVENLGVPFPSTGLDLINAPGAWGITRGNKKVVIGISDAKIDSTNKDLQGRVSKYLKYFDIKSGGTCSHGTSVASVIGARMDNAFGIAGVCSDCDMIAGGYGQFDHIQELVEAGAKVINVSWSLCGFGNYHKNIEERINEYYEEGILIVAAAGNAKICDRNLRDHASNYAYPASYKRVIAVTTIYAECGHYEDCIVDDELYGIINYKLKDRHVRRLKDYNGKFYPINTQWATQHNLAVDISAPAEAYLAGREECGNDEHLFGGLTSNSAPFVTGVIGLIWSENYCLGSAEVESILKLTSEDIENLPGNESLKMKLGAGRLDAYRAVKMAHEMQLDKGIVNISGRDFYRFEFELYSSPYQIEIFNQTFRDSATVDFKARKSIRLKPGSHLKPDKNGFIKLSINPNLPTEECFPKPVVLKPKVAKDSIPNFPRFTDPFEIKRNTSIAGIEIHPAEGVADSDYEVLIEKEDTILFKEKFSLENIASIPLSEIVNEIVTITITTDLYNMIRKYRINIP